MSMVDFLLDYLMAHGAPQYERREPTIWERLASLFVEPMTVTYLHPSGRRMAMTERQYRHFVPIELDMSGSISSYRELLQYRVRRAASTTKDNR